MNVDESKGKRGGGRYGVNFVHFCTVGVGDYASHQAVEVVPSCAYVIRQWIAGNAIMIANETANLAQAQSDEPGIRDHDLLEPLQLLNG